MKLIPKGGFRLGRFALIGALGGLLMLVLSLVFGVSDNAGHLPTCAINIEAIEGAKSLWMLDAKKTAQATPTADDLKPYLKQGYFPVCPHGGKYTINACNLRATCSVCSPTNGPPSIP